jgi:hypothetical protein
MSPDPQSALQVAFRQLDNFSVPGVGTFTRSRVGAQMDHQKKRILPPHERFVLEQGDGHQAPLEDLLGRWFGISATEAKDLSHRTGTYIQEGVKSRSQFKLDGVGTFRQADDGLEFTAEDGLLAQTHDFFGLQTVDYTMGVAEKPSQEKKAEVAKESALANRTVVEPPKPRRKFPTGWVVVLILLLLGAGAAWNWQAELKGVLTDWGVMKDEGAVTDTTGTAKAIADSMARATAIRDSLDAAVEARRQDSLAAIADSGGKKPKGKDKPKPVAKAQPKTPTPKSTPKVNPKPTPKTGTNANTGNTFNDLKHGVRPQAGHYYLVVSSNEIPEEAVEAAKTIGAKVLVPYYQQGYYKVSVFESTSKGQVISKMVSLKDKYPKSWIFWPGMPMRERE